MSIVAILVILIAVIAGRQAVKKVAETGQTNKKVTLVDVRTFRTDSTKISANGTIESSAQVELRGQISAPVTAVNVAIGDWVSAGQVLMTLQNSDINAQLDQAKANLALAEAQSANAGVAVDSAAKSAIDKIRDAYVKVDDTIHTQVDQFFSNPTSNNPQLVFITSNQQLTTNIQSDRMSLEAMIKTWKESITTLSTSTNEDDLNKALDLAQTNLNSTGKFLDEVSEALNSIIITSQTISSSLPSWKLSVSGTRTNINGALAGISAAEAALASAHSALKNPKETQNSDNSVSTTQAQIMSAQAVINNLKVQLAKTIISTPIAGRVGNISVKVGELVSPGQIIASVLNTQSLQLKAYISDSDYSKISYGSAAILENGATGIVTKVAPSIDQNTKKIEVRIAIDGSKSSGLVIGQNARVEIIGKTQSNSNAIYLVPIQNIKIVPGEASVYTVDANSKVKKNQVILGEVKGDFVEVKSGLDDNMQIVSPVYELEEGDTVVAK